MLDYLLSISLWLLVQSLLFSLKLIAETLTTPASGEYEKLKIRVVELLLQHCHRHTSMHFNSSLNVMSSLRSQSQIQGFLITQYETTL